MTYGYAPNNQRIWKGDGSTTDEFVYYSVGAQKLATYTLSAWQEILECRESDQAPPACWNRGQRMHAANCAVDEVMNVRLRAAQSFCDFGNGQNV